MRGKFNQVPAHPTKVAPVALHIFGQHLLDVSGEGKRSWMQAGIIISGFKFKLLPKLGFKRSDRIECLGGKTEEPMAGRIGRHKKLIDPGDGEGGFNFPVGPLHLLGVSWVVRAFVLVDQDSVCG